MKPIILFLLLTLNVIVNAQNSSSDVQSSQILLLQNDKNPGVAFIMSAIIPGAGQMYNGQVKSGLIIFFSEALLLGFIQYDLENSDLNKNLDLIAGVTFSGIYIGSIINAPLYTLKWNKQNGFLTQNNIKLDLALNPISKSIGIKFQY